MENRSFVVIHPKNAALSLDELRNYRKCKFKPIKIGSKRNIVQGTKEEKRELEALYENLKSHLSLRRINRPENLMEAEWDASVGVALVTRKAGKLEKFGFSSNSKLYLEYFEALFLLECGRLILKYYNGQQSVILSIEAAYNLLLGEKESRKYNDYLVFSHLTKCGYILRKHRRYEPIETRKEFTVNDYIWCLLEAELSGKPLPTAMQKNPTVVNDIKKSMMDIKQRIIEQVPVAASSQEAQQEKIDLKFSERVKTSLSDSGRSLSYMKYWQNSRSLLNVLQNEPDFLKFEDLFQSFNIIELNSHLEKPSSALEAMSYEITYDMYLPNDGFKKSSMQQPMFHVLILKTGKPFPNHEDIVHLSIKENHVPILVVSVSDSRQVHAFLYFCSR